MWRLARLLNEIAAVSSREYLTLTQKFHVLGAYYWLRLRSKLARKPSGAISFFGLRIYAPSYANLAQIVREVFVFGDYYFKTDAKAPVIIDCGANIGVTTLFLKRLYPQAKVTALDPSPTAVDALKRNIVGNKLSGVTIVEAAASDHEGEISFWEQTAKPGSSTAIADVHASKTAAAEFSEKRVRATKLSAYVSGPVDMLKLDVEGSETIVIGELIESGAIKHVKRIIMEFHENPENSQNNLDKMVRLLKDSGYKLTFFASEITPSSERMSCMKAHHFLMRADR